MKSLFVTTSNLATNPRLAKELRLAQNIFSEIDVIQFKIGGWSEENTEFLKNEFSNIHFHELSATRKNLIQWFIVSILQKLLEKISVEKLPKILLTYSLNKRSILLNWHLSKTKKRYDWVIAHNPGAFYPAMAFSQRVNAKLGIDVEDYHPGETNNLDISKRMLTLMRQTLPYTNYCSFAAPLIKKEIEKDISKRLNNWFTIINGFPSLEFKEPIECNSEKLKLIWFSQNITPNRGLEKYISVIDQLSDQIELHLIGDLTDVNKKKMINNAKGLIIHNPMKQKDLHYFISQFDVGLAIEPGKDLNNSIAVSNKLLTYVQAGLYVISTPTFGQLGFLNNSNLNYSLVHQEEKEILNCLKQLIQNKDSIRSKKIEQYKKAQKYAWERINKPLIEAWNS